MDQPSPPRRSFWRFSLRELLLVMLAIAAFLGWGRAIYQRYKPFVPTPFASKLDLQGLNDDVQLIRQQLGEPPASWVSASGGGGSGLGDFERNYRFGFPFQAANANALVEKFRQRIRDQLDAHGCRVHGTRRGSSGGMQDFGFRYRRDVVEGSIRVIMIPSGDEARLLVFVEEQRK